MKNRQLPNNSHGFTLIEVLLALAIISIALTALLKVTSQNVENTKRLKDKAISHWVAMQGVAMVQLDMIELNPSIEATEATTLFNSKCYWRVQTSPTPNKHVQLITIKTSFSDTGPFGETVKAFRYLP